MTARPVYQAGIAKIDQLAEKLRQRGVPAPLLRRTQEILYNVGALVTGFKFYCVSLARFKNPMSFLGTPILKSVRAYSGKETTKLINYGGVSCKFY